MTITDRAAVLGIETSLSGQPWYWRGRAGEISANGGLPGSVQGQQGQGDDLTSQLLLARGVERSELEQHRAPTLRNFLPDPSVFRDMDSAAERIAQAILANEQIVVYGDYDVDGATSAALLVRLLDQLGVTASSYIPDRLMEGYGPGGAALVKLAGQGASLIITVDCGAMAFEALQMAHDAGVDVIVVDHHKCAETLPVCHALVNPNRLDESPQGAEHGHLAAVGMAFILGVALLRTLRQREFFAARSEPDLLGLLDLVALGTVADVAPLRGLNRAFVAQGLKIMARRGNIGMAALMDASGLTRPPQAFDLGFALGPRINAGGRVGSSDLGVRLLTSKDAGQAAEIAAELDQLNRERRAIEAEVQQQALEQLEQQDEQAVAVLAGQGWHAGVIGIVSGRVKEQIGRPAIVIALDEDGTGKGSGRSVAGVDLGAAIIEARAAGLLVAGGGHAMAAGLTIKAEKIAEFAEFLNQRLADDVERSLDRRSLSVDAIVTPRAVNPDLVRALEAAGPYGMGWPSPIIVAGPMRLIKCDIVGEDHVRIIAAGDDGARLKAISFRSAATDMGQALLSTGRDRKLWLAGRVKIDDWGQRLAAEMHLVDAAYAD